MNKKEIIEECIDLLDDGASMDEIFEYIEDNTDLDPSEIINEIYKKQIGCLTTPYCFALLKPYSSRQST